MSLTPGPGLGALSATWAPPSDDGGSPVLQYLVTASAGSTNVGPVSVAAPATSAVLTGLTEFVTYTVTVVAVVSSLARAPAPSQKPYGKKLSKPLSASGGEKMRP